MVNCKYSCRWQRHANWIIKKIYIRKCLYVSNFIRKFLKSNFNVIKMWILIQSNSIKSPKSVEHKMLLYCKEFLKCYYKWLSRVNMSAFLILFHILFWKRDIRIVSSKLNYCCYLYFFPTFSCFLPSVINNVVLISF